MAIVSGGEFHPDARQAVKLFRREGQEARSQSLKSLRDPVRGGVDPYSNPYINYF